MFSLFRLVHQRFPRPRPRPLCVHRQEHSASQGLEDGACGSARRPAVARGGVGGGGRVPCRRNLEAQAKAEEPVEQAHRGQSGGKGDRVEEGIGVSAATVPFVCIVQRIGATSEELVYLWFLV